MTCATMASVRAAEILRQNIQRLMDTHGLGRGEFSERINKKRNWASNFFKEPAAGSPEESPSGTTLATLDQIADAFGLRICDLFAEGPSAPTGEEPEPFISLPPEATAMVMSDNHVKILLALLSGIEPARRTALVTRFIHEATAPEGPASDSSLGRSVRRANGPP